MRKATTKEQEEKIVQMYRSGLSVGKIVPSSGFSETFVWRILRNYQVSIRDLRQSHIVYRANHDFFDVIDSEPKAYFVGIMASDGYVHGNEFEICLQERDREILDNFKSVLESQHPIRRKIVKGKVYVRFGFRSPRIIIALKKLGVIERKSNVLCPPQIGELFVWDFYRGMFDGDGSVSEKSIGLCGSYWVVMSLAKLCFTNGIRVRTYQHGESDTYYLVACGKNGRKLASKMYNTLFFALKRKQDKAMMWVDRFKEKDNYGIKDDSPGG